MSSPSPFIVKRVRKVSGGGHHGGSWKIAYADFVTAMMAFFLLMWLTIAAGGKALNAISEYFQRPLALTLEGGKGSGSRMSMLNGGGTDLMHTEGQVHNGEVKHQRIFDERAAAAKAKATRQEVVRLTGLKVKLQSAVDQNKFLKKFKNQLRLDITNEGLRIQIVDKKNRPLFASGSANLEPYTRQILDQVARALEIVPNKISISGHTDATPFHGAGGYNNWDLSSDRANACRRELIAGGMDANKVLRVIGQASAVPLDPKDPYSPVNRRISIIVLNHETETGIEKMGGSVTLDSHGSVVPVSSKGAVSKAPPKGAIAPPPANKRVTPPPKKVVAPPPLPSLQQQTPARQQTSAPASAPTTHHAIPPQPKNSSSQASNSQSSERVIPLPPAP